MVEVGQVVKIGVGQAKVLHYVEGEYVVLERLGFELFGQTEYIVGKYPMFCEYQDTYQVAWERGLYIYNREDLREWF